MMEEEKNTANLCGNWKQFHLMTRGRAHYGQEELTKLMTRILDGKKRINKLESKVVEQDGLQDTAKKALKWIDTKWEQWEIICIIVSFSIISVLVLSVTIVVISKFC
eukprot:GFUD01053669.1.p1 GENE.GFUD01053669.1~~GFUD01053669.1.p1  ORF type:complete len:107 (-),score=16.26 GFUD01053669.1:144-464(-)